MHDPAGNLLDPTGSQSRVSEGNRLDMRGDRHYTYDEFGNLTEEKRGKGQKLTTHYQYDSQHRLFKAELPDASVAQYRYDAFGRRISKTVSSPDNSSSCETIFFWQGDKLIAEVDENSLQHTSYLYEPYTFKPLAMLQGTGDETKVYYYQLDHLGTPQELTNTQGKIVWSAQYRAYGQLAIAEVEEVTNPLRFQGQYHDLETGLYYNRYRYYDPNSGRFTTIDPIALAGGLNNYQYVPNPTGWIDPLGLACKPGDCPEENAWNEFQKDHKGQFQTPEEASKAYSELKTGESPWPYGYVPKDGIMRPGDQFNMALSPSQPSNRPGGFGTSDAIPNTNYVRDQLAVKDAWKPEIDRVVRYEVTQDLPIRTGPVGPQIDGSTYLPGGGSQLELMVPARDRMNYLKVVDENKIE